MAALAMTSALAAALFSGAASAQNYPTRPVTIVVGLPPGGITDWMSRILAQQLTEKWKQSVVVENKTGAGGKIADEYAMHAAPDGYTLLNSTSIIARNLFDKDAMDMEKAMTGLASMLFAPYVIIAPVEAPGKNLAEYLAYAKANPGKINFAAVTNTGQMLDTYALFQLAKVQMTVVPYNGGAPSLRAVVANEVQGYFGAVFGMQAQIAGGRIKALAVTSAARFPLLPDIPTVKEAIGLDFDTGVNYGFGITAATPRDLVQKISSDIVEVVKRPDVQDQVRKQGYEPTSMNSDEFNRQIARDSARLRETARIAGIKPQ
jgi:tripartite-type tricarboxylate transporter receptor subunit TctC